MGYVTLPDIVDKSHPYHDFQDGHRRGQEHADWETLMLLLNNYNKRYKTDWYMTHDD